MISRNIDIIAIGLLLLGAAVYCNTLDIAMKALSPLHRLELYRGIPAPSVSAPLPPQPPLPAISFQ